MIGKSRYNTGNFQESNTVVEELYQIIIANARERGLAKVTGYFTAQADPNPPTFPETHPFTIVEDSRIRKMAGRLGLTPSVISDQEYVVSKSLQGLVSAVRKSQEGTLSPGMQIGMFKGFTKEGFLPETTLITPATLEDIYGCLGLQEIAEEIEPQAINGHSYRTIPTSWGVVIHEAFIETQQGFIGNLTAMLSPPAHPHS